MPNCVQVQGGRKFKPDPPERFGGGKRERFAKVSPGHLIKERSYDKKNENN